MRLRVFAALAVLAVLGTGCVVKVQHAASADEAFRAARTEAERFQGRPGPARRINVLVFEKDEGKLVRVR